MAGHSAQNSAIVSGPAARAYDLHYDYTSFDNPNTPTANPHFGQAQFSVSDEFGTAIDVSVNVDCVNVFAQVPYVGAGWFSGIATKVSEPDRRDATVGATR